MKKVTIFSGCVAALLMAAGVLSGTCERNTLSAGFGKEDGDALKLKADPAVVCVGDTSVLTVTINRVCNDPTKITIYPLKTVDENSIVIPAGSRSASKSTLSLNTLGRHTVTGLLDNAAVPIPPTDTAKIDVVKVCWTVEYLSNDFVAQNYTERVPQAATKEYTAVLAALDAIITTLNVANQNNQQNPSWAQTVQNIQTHINTFNGYSNISGGGATYTKGIFNSASGGAKFRHTITPDFFSVDNIVSSIVVNERSSTGDFSHLSDITNASDQQVDHWTSKSFHGTCTVLYSIVAAGESFHFPDLNYGQDTVTQTINSEVGYYYNQILFENYVTGVMWDINQWRRVKDQGIDKINTISNHPILSTVPVLAQVVANIIGQSAQAAWKSHIKSEAEDCLDVWMKYLDDLHPTMEDAFSEWSTSSSSEQYSHNIIPVRYVLSGLSSDIGGW